MNIARIGGTERAVCNLYDMLKNRNINVRIVSLVGRQEELRNNFEDVIFLDMPILGVNFHNKMTWFYSCYKKISALNVADNSFFIGTGHNVNVVLSFCKLKKKKIKVISCEHIQLKSIPWFSRQVMRCFYQYSDAVVLLSQSARSTFLQYFPELENRTHVIPNVLPFTPQKNNLNREQRIIMVGRLSSEKGYERVVPIAKYLLLNYPQWRIDIYGDGILKNELGNLFAINGLSNVNLKGITNDVESEYMKSSILMMTSYSEAMPMVVLEANACWLPVVAYECEGTNELIRNGLNGFVISNDDVMSFTEKISNLIDDNRRREEMSIYSHEFSYEFSSDKIVIMWMSLFDKCQN